MSSSAADMLRLLHRSDAAAADEKRDEPHILPPAPLAAASSPRRKLDFGPSPIRGTVASEPRFPGPWLEPSFAKVPEKQEEALVESFLHANAEWLPDVYEILSNAYSKRYPSKLKPIWHTEATLARAARRWPPGMFIPAQDRARFMHYVLHGSVSRKLDLGFERVVGWARTWHSRSAVAREFRSFLPFFTNLHTATIFLAVAHFYSLFDVTSLYALRGVNHHPLDTQASVVEGYVQQLAEGRWRGGEWIC